uniref:FH2 domain-containing protein n=1 Tax=Setaria digitata TaxID=48799 RepID=A0A915PYV0_9BILA
MSEVILDSQDTVEPDSMRVLSEHEDSFATSPTNLNASLRSNSSGSYVTAFCDSFGSDEMLKVMSSSVYNSEETNKELLRQSKRQGSFDADSGNGGSPPPLQHVGIDTTDLEVNNRTAISALLQQELQEGSVRVLDKRSRSVQTILRELQSKSVSDDVKARNLASLNRVILQCKEYMQRYSVRQDLMSLGLFNALPSLIESGNREVESELEIFFASESNDNLVGTGSRHPIDTFQAAYVKLKHSASADILLDILELIARIEPSGKRLRGVLHYLQRGHLRSEGVQTEAAMENKASSFCDIVASQNVSKSIITAAQDNLVLKESSSVLQTIRRPRSSSRMKRCSGNRKIEVENIPFIDDETSVVAPHMNLDKTNGGKSPKLTMSPKSTHSRPSIKKQSLGKTPTVPTVPPPPPPPPPAPEFLNSALSRQTSISTTAGSPVIVKSVSVYKKKCATNTVAWETIKPEMVVTRSTIWSDQSGIYAEFNQRERDRLEKVFERVHASNSRVTASQDRAQNVTVDRKAGSATTGGFTEKRALNLGIVLARFRPLTLEQLIQKLESFSISDLSLDYLSSLLKHFPTPDELAYFAKMKTADHLKDAELFCFLVARKSLLRLRIELKVLADNIVTDLARQLDSTRLLLTATDGLYNSPSINVFFHRCLQYGNFLNQSTFAAGASGFALSSLLAALNTKGTGAASSIRLVDVLAEYADENLRSVVKVLDFLDSAKKYSIDELEKSEASLRCSLEMSLKSLQECGDSKLYSYYSPVIMDSIAKCGQLSRSIKKVRHNENRLKEYYCAPKLCLENILEILSSAIKLFQDSLVKAEARVARAQRLQKQRVSAGRDTTDIHECRRRKNDRTRIFAPPNVKDLIDIINSNECR